MKPFRLASALVLTLFLHPGGGQAAPQPADSGPFADMQVNLRAEPCVRLRSGASLDRSILDCLEPGTRLRVMGSISGWSHVRLLDGTEGWVDSGYLEPAPELATGPAAAAPQPAAAPDGEMRSQITALEGQLEAMAARRDATEERLRNTVEAADAAQREVSRLRQQVQEMESRAAAGADTNRLETELAQARLRGTELEEQLASAEGRLVRAAGLNAEQERRIEALDASLSAAQARQEEQQRALTAAEERLGTAEQAAAGEDQLAQRAEAELAAARSRETEARQALAASENRLRAAQEANTDQADRLQQMRAELAAARTSESDLRQALAGAEDRARAAAEQAQAAARSSTGLEARIAEQASRIAELEAAPAPDSPRRSELKRQLEEVRGELRDAREANARLGDRIAQLEAAAPATEEREAGLRRELAAAEERLAAAERLGAEQARRLEALTGELADARVRIAEAELRSRLAPEPAAPEPAERAVRVREPIVSAPEPPPVTAEPELAVRMPAPMREQAAAPPPEPVVAPLSGIDAAINTVRAWAAAWSDQRVEDYLSFYAPEFQPPGGLSRESWEAQRRQRLSRPSFIRVTISSLSAQGAADGRVTVTFRQEYESDSFADTVTKVLTLVEQQGVWRLVSESATP